MKKALIFAILLLFVFVSSVFCDVPNTTYGFKINTLPHPDRAYDLVLHFYSIDSANEWNKGLNAGQFSLSHSDVTQLDLDTAKGLAEPQVIVAFETRYIYGFNFWLKFSRMTTSGTAFRGEYKVRIYDRYFYKNFNNITTGSDSLDYSNSSVGITLYDASFVSDDGQGGSTSLDNIEVVIAFPNMTLGGSDKGRERWMYPIAFDFSDYISSYPAGDYSGTVTLEVIAQ